MWFKDFSPTTWPITCYVSHFDPSTTITPLQKVMEHASCSVNALGSLQDTSLLNINELSNLSRRD